MTELETLQWLVVDLSYNLTDEGPDYSGEGLDMMRRRAANALPANMLPDFLLAYRDAIT